MLQKKERKQQNLETKRSCMTVALPFMIYVSCCFSEKTGVVCHCHGVVWPDMLSSTQIIVTSRKQQLIHYSKY